MENKDIRDNKILKGYNKFRKFATGNSLDDLAYNDKKFSIISSIKEKLHLYIIGLIICIFVNWKLTIALLFTLAFAFYFEKFILTAKKAAQDAENEIKQEREIE